MAAFLPVVSSNITAVKYDREAGRLVVQFGESFYVYSNVPGDIVLDFIFAESIGGKFNELVKKGEFPYKKVSAVEANA